MITFLLGATLALAANIEVDIDPAVPKPSQTFRLSILAKKIPCEGADLRLEFPARWSMITRSKSARGAGCKWIFQFLPFAAGDFRITGGKINQIALPDIRVPVGVETAKAIAEEPTDTAARAWLNQFRYTIADYVADEPQGNSTFSIEACRPPANRVVPVLLRKVKKYRHPYRFKEGCDLNGKSEFALDRDLQIDLKVRNAGELTRMKGDLRMSVEPISPTRFKQATLWQEGVAYEGPDRDREFARFSFYHRREFNLDVGQGRTETTDNQGEILLTEFRGQPLSLRAPLPFRAPEVARPAAVIHE